MALQEYFYGDRTFLFEERDVPKGAKLVGDIKESALPLRAVDGDEGVQEIEDDKAKGAEVRVTEEVGTKQEEETEEVPAETEAEEVEVKEAPAPENKGRKAATKADKPEAK